MILTRITQVFLPWHRHDSESFAWLFSWKLNNSPPQFRHQLFGGGPVGPVNVMFIPPLISPGLVWDFPWKCPICSLRQLVMGMAREFPLGSSLGVPTWAFPGKCPIYQLRQLNMGTAREFPPGTPQGVPTWYFPGSSHLVLPSRAGWEFGWGMSVCSRGRESL